MVISYDDGIPLWCSVRVVENVMAAAAEVSRVERVVMKCIAKSLRHARQRCGLTASWIAKADGAEYKWYMNVASCGIIRQTT